MIENKPVNNPKASKPRDQRETPRVALPQGEQWPRWVGHASVRINAKQLPGPMPLLFNLQIYSVHCTVPIMMSNKKFRVLL